MSELLGRLRAAWDDLQPRERVLLGSAGGLTVVMVAYFAIAQPLLALTTAGGGGGIEAADQRLEAMKRVRREYDEVTSRLSGVEQRVQRKGQNRNILSLLDTLAASSAVKIDSMEQRQAANNDKYRETKVEVALKRVTLTDTVKYLHNIEDAKQLLSVKSLRVKTRADDPQLLDVTFAVSSFEPL